MQGRRSGQSKHLKGGSLWKSLNSQLWYFLAWKYEAWLGLRFYVVEPVLLLLFHSSIFRRLCFIARCKVRQCRINTGPFNCPFSPVQEWKNGQKGNLQRERRFTCQGSFWFTGSACRGTVWLRLGLFHLQPFPFSSWIAVVYVVEFSCNF